MIAALLAHEFQRESYDWQSHAAGLCVHTSHCTAVETHTHVHTKTHSHSSAGRATCNKTSDVSAKRQQTYTQLTDTSPVFLKKSKMKHISLSFPCFLSVFVSL